MKNLGDVPRRARLSADEFYDAFLYPERPVVLPDLCTGWSAMKKWDASYLVEAFGDYPVIAHHHPEGLFTAWQRMRVQTTLGKIIEDKDPRTFAAADFMPDCPYLIEDIDIPHLIKPEWIEDEGRVWVQPRGNRTGLHWDSFNSLLTVVRGRKRVLLFSPEQLDRLYPCHVTGSKDFSRGSWSQADVFAPDYGKFPDMAGASYHEVLVEAGSTLLIPRHWWHAVENLGDPTIAVSFFVTPQGKPELTFYYDRRLIAGMSIKIGVLTGARASSNTI